MPSAVTTTPVSSVAVVDKLKFWDTADPFTATWAELGLKPRRRAVTVMVVPLADAGTVKVYLPWSSVNPPTRSVGTLTLAPTTGAPPVPVTWPLTVVPWACAYAGANPSTTAATARKRAILPVIPILHLAESGTGMVGRRSQRGHSSRFGDKRLCRVCTSEEAESAISRAGRACSALNSRASSIEDGGIQSINQT